MSVPSRDQINGCILYVQYILSYLLKTGLEVDIVEFNDNLCKLMTK